MPRLINLPLIDETGAGTALVQVETGQVMSREDADIADCSNCARSPAKLAMSMFDRWSVMTTPPLRPSVRVFTRPVHAFLRGSCVGDGDSGSMRPDMRPHSTFARIALPALGTVLAVIAVGLLLKTSAGWTSMEMSVLRRVNLLHTAQLDWMALGINWLFSAAVAVVLVLITTGSILWVTRRPRVAIQFLLIVMIPTFGATVIKVLVQRPRPDIASLPHILVLEPGGLSFPSGHTSFAVCFLLGLIVVAVGQWWRPLLIGAAVVVALATAASRVYLGVHYPSDVVASVVYATAAATLVRIGRAHV